MNIELFSEQNQGTYKSGSNSEFRATNKFPNLKGVKPHASTTNGTRQDKTQ